MEEKQFSTSAYLGGIIFVIVAGLSLGLILQKGGFHQKDIQKVTIVRKKETNTSEFNKFPRNNPKTQKESKSNLAEKNYPNVMDELTPNDSYKVIGEVFGEGKSKKSMKEFFGNYIGGAYLYHYVYYRRLLKAAEEFGVELSSKEAQTVIGNRMPSVLSNRRVQEQLKTLKLTTNNYEAWFRHKAFIEWLGNRLFEVPEIGDPYLLEKFQKTYGKNGIHYDIKQIMLVNRPRQSRFFPESQYDKEKPKIEVALKEKAEKLILDLTKNPKDWPKMVQEVSEDRRKSRNQGKLGPVFTEEKFGQETYQGVLALKPGSIYPKPVRGDVGWHILKLDDFGESSKIKFRGVYFKGKTQDKGDLEEAGKRALALYELLEKAPSAESKATIFQQAIENSDDKATKERKGESFFVSKSQSPYIYPIAEKLKLNEYSGVIKDSYGYWIVQLISKQKEPLVSHILLSLDYLSSKQRWIDENFESEATKRINEVAEILAAGKKDWMTLFEEYSEAPALPNEKQGLFRNVKIGHYGEAFINTLGTLKIGERKIIKHNYGISLVEMVEKKQAKFEDHRETFLERAKKNPRRKQHVMKFLAEYFPFERTKDGALRLKDETLSIEKYHEYIFHNFYFEQIQTFLEFEALKKLASGFSLSEEEIQKKLLATREDWLQKNFGGDEKKLKEYCDSYFTTVDEFLKIQRYKIEKEAYENHIVQKAKLSEAELKKLFEQKYGYLQKDEQNRMIAVQYHIRQILKYSQIIFSKEVTKEQFDENTQKTYIESKQKIANKLLKELKENPQKFETFVRQHSEDRKTKQNKGRLPTLDLFGKGFEEAIKNKKGDEPELYKSSKGIHIYKRLPDLHRNVVCRHILKKVKANARANIRPKQKKEILRLKAELEKIRDQLEIKFKETPEKIGPEFYQSFGEYAKTHTEDRGSRTNLGLIQAPLSRLAKPFAEACRTAKSYELVGPIETTYGFHLIVVENIDFDIQASHIMISTDFNAYKNEKLLGKLPKIARESIEKAKAELDAGASFDEIAQKYSEVFGTPEEKMVYTKRKYGPNYRNQVTRLKVGEFSEIVKSTLGYHIIQLEKKEVIYFKDKKAELIESLKKAKMEESKKKMILRRELMKANLRGVAYQWYQD